ncbi:MAG: hypothetical protein NTY64_14245, partial [Deltaproteobacteria bacterium]|nr:hypothetical protein [Deltaproteobacteria bacterium]
MFLLADFLPEEAVDPKPLFLVEHFGGDGSPAGGQLVDDGDIQVPIEGHSQGTRDRGGGHDQ